MKFFEKFAHNLNGEPWKASLLRAFVWIVTLTVAFFDGVSRTFIFLESFRTMSFVLIFYGGFKRTKKRFMK